MLYRSGVASCVLLSAMALPAFAQQVPNPKADHVKLSEITVLGSRGATDKDKLPHSIETILVPEITLEQSNDFGEVLDGIPNVSINGGPRSSAKTVQIRGISGDRVLMLIDGVRQSSTKGHVGRSFVDPGMLRRVDIERGPASVQWGSGALGGVVSMETKNAADFLKPGQKVGFRIHDSYQSATDGRASSLAAYGHLSEKVDGLVYASHRDNEDMELGSGDKEPYSGYKENTGLAKLSIYPTLNQSLTFSHRAERLYGLAPSNPTESGQTASKIIDRDIRTNTSRVNWQVFPDNNLIDLETQIYHSRTLIEGDKITGGARHQETQLTRTGADIVNTSRLSLGPTTQTFTYGADGHRDTTRGRENGAPRGGYPDAKRYIGGVFLQDAIGWQNWTLTGGLRWDSYHSSSDNNVGKDQSENLLSSQIGLTWQATNWLTAYVSYAEAFRAPTLEELYATGTHFGSNQFIPNPNLKPEKAANKEIGLRGHWQGLFTDNDQLRVEAAAFRNDIRDYIGLDVNFVPPFGGTTKSENVQNARLTGFEINTDYQLNHWFIGVGYGQTHGDNRTDNEPLEDIAPAKATLRTGFAHLPWDGRITFVAHFIDRQDRLPTGKEATPGYSRYDLFTSWHPTESVELNAGITNLTNKDYRQHNATVHGQGRSARLGINWKF